MNHPYYGGPPENSQILEPATFRGVWNNPYGWAR